MRESYSLYVTFNGEKERTLISDDIVPFVFYENKIVYFKSLPYEQCKTMYTYEDGHKVLDYYGGDVYVMNPDGTDDHLLFHTDEFITGMTTSKTHPHVTGDYFGIMITSINKDNFKENLLIANINTGDYVVCRAQ